MEESDRSGPVELHVLQKVTTLKAEDVEAFDTYNGLCDTDMEPLQMDNLLQLDQCFSSSQTLVKVEIPPDEPEVDVFFQDGVTWEFTELDHDKACKTAANARGDFCLENPTAEEIATVNAAVTGANAESLESLNQIKTRSDEYSSAKYQPMVKLCRLETLPEASSMLLRFQKTTKEGNYKCFQDGHQSGGRVVSNGFIATESKDGTSIGINSSVSENTAAVTGSLKDPREPTLHKDQSNIGGSRNDLRVFDKPEIDQTKHRRKKKSLQPVLCKICQKMFSSACTLHRHMRQIHNREKPHKCYVCNKSFGRPDSLMVHMLIHTGVKPHVCDICGKSYRQRGGLLEHKLSHTGERNFECPTCHRCFITKPTLKKHMSVHTGERPYSCKVCEKRFRTLGGLSLHKNVHSGEKPVSCEVCGKGFSGSGYLKLHMRIHTGEKPFECEVCNKRFALLRYLSEHTLLHTGEKPHVCKQCGKAFRKLSGLKNHKYSHLAEKQFSCDICSKKFTRPDSLRGHLRIHTGEKPHVCKICKMGFTLRKNLALHMKRHSTKCDYKCEVCDREFKQSRYLKEHMKTHTQEKQYCCKLCDRKYYRPASLYTHMQSHEKETEDNV